MLLPNEIVGNGNPSLLPALGGQEMKSVDAQVGERRGSVDEKVDAIPEPRLLLEVAAADGFRERVRQ
jgi:hypothetical protein